MIALIISMLTLLPLTNSEVRQMAADSGSDVLSHPTRVRVGHCLIHGSWARCPVRVWHKTNYCRYQLHIRKRGINYTTEPKDVTCWIKEN